MNEAERIFDTIASRRMRNWNMGRFKKDFPTLHAVVLESIETSAIFSMEVIDPQVVPYYCTCGEPTEHGNDDEGTPYCIECQKYLN